MTENKSPPAEIKKKNNLELALYLERGNLVRDSMKHMIDLRSNIFQLTNYYIVFQAVILAALVNSNTALSPKDGYLLAGLSIIPATLNICAISIIGKEFIKADADHQKYMVAYDALFGELYGPASSDDDGAKVEFREDRFKKKMFHFVLSLCVLLLVCFWVIMIMGFVKITGRDVDHEKLLRVTERDEKCARFCVAWWKEVGGFGPPNIPPYP